MNDKIRMWLYYLWAVVNLVNMIFSIGPVTKFIWGLMTGIALFLAIDTTRKVRDPKQRRKKQ